MTVLHSVRGVLLHLGQYIAYDARVIVRGFFRPRDVDGYVGKLGPGQCMVEVVFHEIAAND